MARKKLGPRPFMFPKPAVLVGAMVKGKPNFETVANCGIVNYDPPMISVASARAHYTNIGVRQHKTFSVNIASTKMAKAVDWCGLNSGRRVDKSEVFEVFFGELETAPMIKESPICFECRLHKTLRFEDEDCFIGEIVAIHADSKCLTKGKPDIRKIDPLIYSTSDRMYFKLGKEIGPSYTIGKQWKPKTGRGK